MMLYSGEKWCGFGHWDNLRSCGELPSSFPFTVSPPGTSSHVVYPARVPFLQLCTSSSSLSSEVLLSFHLLQEAFSDFSHCSP